MVSDAEAGGRVRTARTMSNPRPRRFLDLELVEMNFCTGTGICEGWCVKFKGIAA
jgi:Pyruvate/2-oxoacid:ferredoxin oxidoreductase delta subunit